MQPVNSQPLILHVLSGDLWGGSEAQMEMQIVAQRELGLDSRALLFNSAETARRYRAAGIPILELDESKGLPTLFRSCWRAIKSLKPDVVVTHGYKETITAGLICSIRGIPFYSMFHGSSESYRGLKRIKMACYLQIYSALSRYLARGRISVTAALAEELGVDAVVVHNVATANQVKFEGESTLKDRPAIVSVGRLVRVKRFDRAILALAELGPEEATLYLIGDGPERRDLEELLGSTGLEGRVRFLGFCPEARTIIADSDLLLLTSESEGLPTVVLEAILSGIPVVATDLPGLREIKQLFPDYPLLLVKETADFPDNIREGLRQGRVAPAPEIIEYLSPTRAAKQFKEVII